VMVSTHLLQNVESFCDRLLILKNGRMVATGELSELLARYGGRSLEETFLDIVQRAPRGTWAREEQRM